MREPFPSFTLCQLQGSHSLLTLPSPFFSPSRQRHAHCQTARCGSLLCECVCVCICTCKYSASSVIQTSIIRILDYPNKPEGRLRNFKMCLRMRNLPTVVGVADIRSLRSLRDHGPIADVSFTKDMTKSKRKRKASSIINDKVSIV